MKDSSKKMHIATVSCTATYFVDDVLQTCTRHVWGTLRVLNLTLCWTINMKHSLELQWNR